MQNITNSLNQHTDSLSEQEDAHLRQSGSIYLALTAGLLVILWLNAPVEILIFHKLLGTFLGILTLTPLYFWVQSKEKPMPFMELILLHYFFIFSPPVFLGPVKFVGATQASVIQGYDLTKLLLIVFLGISCLFVGYYVVRFPKLNALMAFHLDWNRAIIFFLVYLGISSISPVLIPRLPAVLAKFGSLAFKVNGSVATYALAFLMYSGRLSPQQRKIYLAELSFFMTVSLASGWLNMFVYPMAGFFLGMVQAKNRIPWIKILCVCLLIIVLQSSKQAYRQAYWGDRMGGERFVSIADPISRTTHWLKMALSNIGSIGEGSKELAQVRVNHLSFFGHVVRVTPEYIPYINGYSYKFVPAMFIPRFLWPEKPSTMQVADDLTLRYGWQAEYLIGKVALSPGLMDEAYMNFGVTGIIIIMVLFGAFVRWLTDNLGNPANGFGWQLAFIGYMLSGGLMITWTATSYLGGLWQTVFVIVVLYWPLRVNPKSVYE